MQNDNILDKERLSLLFGDNGDFLKEIFSIVQEDFPANLKSLEEAHSSAQYEAALRLAHTLKGSLANIGGNKASHIAAQIHDSYKQGRYPEAETLLPVLSHEIDAFIFAFQDFINAEKST